MILFIAPSCGGRCIGFIIFVSRALEQLLIVVSELYEAGVR